MDLNFTNDQIIYTAGCDFVYRKLDNKDHQSTVLINTLTTHPVICGRLIKDLIIYFVWTEVWVSRAVAIYPIRAF